MSAPQISVRTIDLTVANTDKRVTIDAPVFYVLRIDAPATFRTDREADAVPLQARPYCATKADQWGEIYISNGASGVTGAKLILAWGSGFQMGDAASRGREIVQTVSGEGGFLPERLGGALAPGETVPTGSSASERIDIAGMDRLRIRAKVSGISGVEALSSQAGQTDLRFGAQAVDEAGGRAFLVGESNAILEVVDISTPTNPVSLGTVDLSTTFSKVVNIAYDPQADSVILEGDDTSATPLSTVAVVDVSTSSTPSLTGSVVTSFEMSNRGIWAVFSGTGPLEGAMAILPSNDVAVVTINHDNELQPVVYAVDYSDPANPVEGNSVVGPPDVHDDQLGMAADDTRSLVAIGSYEGVTILEAPDANNLATQGSVASTSSSAGFGVAMNASAEVLYYGDFNEIVAVNYADPANPVELSRVALPRNNGEVRAVAYDATNDLIWCTNLDDDRIYLLGTGDARNPRSIGSVTGGTVDRPARCAAFEAEGVGLLGAFGSGDLVLVEPDLGGDELRLFYLDPNGERVSAGNPTAVALRDEREAVLEVDVVGEAAAEIEVAAQSGATATIEHVDRYAE